MEDLYFSIFYCTVRYQERLELLALSIHLHDSNDFLNKEEAMLCREKRLKKLEGSE